MALTVRAPKAFRRVAPGPAAAAVALTVWALQAPRRATHHAHPHLEAAEAAHAPLHGDQLPGQPPLTVVPPSNNIIDMLHGQDINLGDKFVKYTWMDPLILAGRPDAREAIYNFYLLIGCNLDVRESDPNKRSKSWFHRSVWHYDFVMGANHKSFGLKVNAFICNLIVYGLSGEDVQIAEESGVDLVNDIPTRPSKKKKVEQAATPINQLDSVDGFLNVFFGHHAARVRSNFEATDAYGKLFTSISDEWSADDTAYRESRALRMFHATSEFSEAMVSCSGALYLYSVNRGGVWW